MARFLIFSYCLIAVLLLRCSSEARQCRNYAKGVSPENLELITEGPKGTFLEYFRADVIKTNAIKRCRIFEQYAGSNPRMAKELRFNLDGNVVSVTNHYFSDWKNGTDRGAYVYSYDSHKRLVEWKGIIEEGEKDSVRNVLTYSPSGLVLSRKTYEFSKKLKPEADPHLPRQKDFEVVPTWSLERTSLFCSDSNRVLVETTYDDGLVEVQGYHLKFDSLHRVDAMIRIDDFLTETRSYLYGKNTIQETQKREKKGAVKSIFHVEYTLNENGQMVERASLDDNGNISSTVIISYNENATVAEIKWGNTVHQFEYVN